MLQTTTKVAEWAQHNNMLTQNTADFNAILVQKVHTVDLLVCSEKWLGVMV